MSNTERDQQIHDERKEGATFALLAAKHEISAPRVRQIFERVSMAGGVAGRHTELTKLSRSIHRALDVPCHWAEVPMREYLPKVTCREIMSSHGTGPKTINLAQTLCAEYGVTMECGCPSGCTDPAAEKPESYKDLLQLIMDTEDISAEVRVKIEMRLAYKAPVKTFTVGRQRRRR